ncbi:hypothetical protein PUN28_002143 [Cardiocondyla obscurior]|uniref:Uncharacterized protein n=1 Tax=Cardiocondyla obscurior TaxID=286306 RepID=A0AAW2GSY6_9HYME
MLRLQATTNITLIEIKQRLQKIENIIKRNGLDPVINDGLITQFLPLDTLERIKEFEELLKNSEEAVVQFVSTFYSNCVLFKKYLFTKNTLFLQKEYLRKTGGNNPKDNIHRVMKKILTNECAMLCSMKGIRNNFRIGDLRIIKNSRKELISRHDHLTEAEFDSIVAEWLRFAKQRKEREDKIKDRNDENN